MVSAFEAKNPGAGPTPGKTFVDPAQVNQGLLRTVKMTNAGNKPVTTNQRLVDGAIWLDDTKDPRYTRDGGWYINGKLADDVPHTAPLAKTTLASGHETVQDDLGNVYLHPAMGLPGIKDADWYHRQDAKPAYTPPEATRLTGLGSWGAPADLQAPPPAQVYVRGKRDASLLDKFNRNASQTSTAKVWEATKATVNEMVQPLLDRFSGEKPPPRAPGLVARWPWAPWTAPAAAWSRAPWALARRLGAPSPGTRPRCSRAGTPSTRASSP
jgi:hypothetical protein